MAYRELATGHRWGVDSDAGRALLEIWNSRNAVGVPLRSMRGGPPNRESESPDSTRRAGRLAAIRRALGGDGHEDRERERAEVIAEANALVREIRETADWLERRKTFLNGSR